MSRARLKNSYTLNVDNFLNMISKYSTSFNFSRKFHLSSFAHHFLSVFLFFFLLFIHCHVNVFCLFLSVLPWTAEELASQLILEWKVSYWQISEKVLKLFVPSLLSTEEELLILIYTILIFIANTLLVP